MSENEKTVGKITITVTEDELSFESDFDVATMLYFMELTRLRILTNSTEE